MAQKIQLGGDNPQQRFGHTFSLINKHKGVLFGGAVGDTGKYVITGDTFLCDLALRKWKKLENKGSCPSSRAAHAAVYCENCLYIYGGALGGGELSDDQLYQLNIGTNQENATWSIVSYDGVSPGRRYGHVMVFLKPFLIVFGGNTGTQPVNQVFSFDLIQSKVWTRVNTGSQKPPPRVYHSAAVCKTGSANGMMVVFGGRTTDQSALNDTWGLRKHRDGKIDWVKAPYRPNQIPPKGRYQHSVLFLGTLMLVIGGRNNSIGENLPTQVYETQTSQWFKLLSVQRFRHACWIADTYLYIHAGFEQESPNIPTDSILKIDLAKSLKQHPSLFNSLTQQFAIQPFDSNQSPSSSGGQNHTHQHSSSSANPNIGGRVSNPSANLGHNEQTINSNTFLGKKMFGSGTNNKSIKLCPQVFCVNFDDNDNQRVDKLAINQLQQENKRLKQPISVSTNKYMLQKIYGPILSLLFMKQSVPTSLHSIIDLIIPLCDEVQKIVASQTTLLRLRAPLKIFGDIHGQITDLNRFFQTFGAPTDDLSLKGDIEAFNYLFLGDYVDKGNRSVQTILLLFALKLKYPEDVHLLRGSHEDRRINRFMGFGDQCFSKLKQQNLDSAGSFFQRVNRIFDLLPLAAVVEDKIFCVHGGIGNTLRLISEIDNIQKPLQVNHNPKSTSQKIVYELLWSDPSQEGQNVLNNNHDYFKTRQNFKFGPLKTNRFCQQNQITHIIRSHQPNTSGINLSNNKVITVFSCTDYCGQKNSGAMIVVKKSMQIVNQTLQFSYGQSNRWEAAGKAPSTNSGEQQSLRSINHTPPKK